jgi:hypothetical protein
LPEAPAVARYDLFERVDHRRRVDCPERSSHRPRQPDFGQERDAAPVVTGDRGSVADNEPPAFEPGVFGHACEQTTGLSIRKGKNRHFFVSVESDDDTRRPPAELSGAVVEHHGATELQAAATHGELELQGPGSVLPDASETGLAYENCTRQAREAPGDEVVVVRVAESGDDEEDGRDEQEECTQAEVHGSSLVRMDAFLSPLGRLLSFQK